jgi:hypothetical protein
MESRKPPEIAPEPGPEYDTEGESSFSGIGSPRGRALHRSNPYDHLVVEIVVIQLATV